MYNVAGHYSWACALTFTIQNESQNILSSPKKGLQIVLSYEVFAEEKKQCPCCAILVVEFNEYDDDDDDVLWGASTTPQKCLPKIILDIINFLPQLYLSALIIHYWHWRTNTQMKQTYAHTLDLFSQKSITRQFAHPLLKKITLDLFVLNKLYYHLLECIMCPSLLSWRALRFHDNTHYSDG